MFLSPLSTDSFCLPGLACPAALPLSWVFLVAFPCRPWERSRLSPQRPLPWRPPWLSDVPPPSLRSLAVACSARQRQRRALAAPWSSWYPPSWYPCRPRLLFPPHRLRPFSWSRLRRLSCPCPLRLTLQLPDFSDFQEPWFGPC